MKHAVPSDGLDQPQRAWAWLTIILSVTLAVLDGSVANVALPTIAQDFGADPADAIWIVNGYQLAVVAAILPMASLGGIYGYRRAYLGGIAIFTLASLGCVFATSLPMLITARVVQGFGAAGLMALNIALLRYIVPKARFGTAVGLNSVIVAAAATVGPTLAGGILSIASWPWLFAINLPLGIAAVGSGIFSLPESDRAQRSFDWLSALLSAVAVGLLILCIDGLGRGADWPWIAAGAVACAIAWWQLYRREVGIADPLLPLDLLRLPLFSLSIGTSVSSFVAQMSAFVSLPFILQSNFGFSPLEVGVLMMPWPLAIGIAAPISGRLSDSFSPALMCSAALAVFAVGLLLLASLPPEPSAPDIMWRMALCGIGFGFFQSPNNRTLLLSAPKPRSGAASGMLSMARLTGQTIGAALVAMLLSLFGLANASNALVVAACFAGLAAVVSVTRLRLYESWQRED